MKYKAFTIFIFLTFLHCHHVQAFDETIKIDNYSYKDGLTTSTVSSTYKDSRGFLWLCTSNGLFRFDGYSFRNINTLLNDFLNCGTFCIVEDKEQNLWIGTSGNGLVCYNTHTEQLIPIKLSKGNNTKVSKILFFRDKIWLATDQGLLITGKPLNPNEKDILQTEVLLPDPIHPYLQDNFINDLYVEPGSNSVWVGTNSALYELNATTLAFSRIDSHFQNSIRSLASYFGKIVASSWDGGIFAVNPKTLRLESDPYISYINTIVGDKRVKTALFDNQHRCWVATVDHGLYIFEKMSNDNFSFTNYRNDEKHPEYLKSDFINHLYIDNSGIAWLSMNQPALSKVYFQKSNINYYTFPKTNNDSKPREILSVYPSLDKNKVWVTTNGSGVYLIDIKTNDFKQFTSNNPGIQFQNNDIGFCYQDRKGNLWIVYRRIGLYVVPAGEVNKLTNNTAHATITPIEINRLVYGNRMINSYITRFFEDSEDRLWIGAWGSLFTVELKPGFGDAKTTEQLLSNSKTSVVYVDLRKDKADFTVSPVLSFTETDKHKFWIGTLDAGIIEFTETSKNRFSGKQAGVTNMLPSHCINYLYKDKRQGIWIATPSGLCYWNRHNLRTIGIKDGLSSDIIRNIVEDKHQNIWCSTTYGISRVNVNDFTISNFFYTDKEKLNQYILNAAVQASDGTMCFSTNEALVTINPEIAEIKRPVAPVYFTDIRIDNKTVIPLEKYSGAQVIKTNINDSKVITVPYNHTLSLEFAALDFVAPERLTYKYRIGNSGEWIILNSNQRSLSLPNMKHGEYVLHIMLANATDDNQGRSITIVYLPPFWQSKPALFVYAALLLLIFIVYRRWTIQRLMQKSIIEKERYERKKLEELDKMKTEFFSNISHEFRTPLSLIINPLEKLAKNGALTGNDKEKVNLILKSSNRLLTLTNELMDFSKLEKQLLVPRFQVLDIVHFTSEACTTFNNLADSKNIDFRVNSSFESLLLPLDKKMMEKVILNLLSNAFKFTPANGVILVNLSKETLENCDCIKVSVVNTGEGIAAENIDRIFDRYYQVNNVQNRNLEGTGIGLSLVKSFVELHHGKVMVKSEPGVETCFDVYLPLVQESIATDADNRMQDDEIPAKDFAASQETLEKSEQYRILLVEDEEDIRNYIAEELSADFKVFTATNGEEGITMANELIPDLIITDVMMPVMSGIELCKTLKKQMVTSHIPIIILSAKTSVDKQIEGLEMGADVYMIKPFSLEHLKTQIIRLIRFKETVYSRYLKETSLLPKGGTTTKLDEEFMEKVVSFIETHLTNTDLNVDQLASCVALSKVQTYRKVKAISGQTIVEFIRTIRLKKAAELIAEGKLSFAEIAYETGFSSPSYFTKCFHDHFGKTPSEYASA